MSKSAQKVRRRSVSTQLLRRAVEALRQPGLGGAMIEGLEDRKLLSGVFLQGDFVEVGVHESGSFGTADAAPSGYHPFPTTSGRKLGFVADPGKDGWTVGTSTVPAQSGDYFVPGVPEEGWTIQWNNGGTAVDSRQRFTNAGQATSTAPGTSNFGVPQTSSTKSSTATSQRNTWVGTASGKGSASNQKVRVTQTTSVGKGDLFFVMNVTLTNTGTTSVQNLKYMRSVDPDHEQQLPGGTFGTNNYVAFQPANAVGATIPAGNNNKALVVAKGEDYGLTLGLGAIDPRATVSSEGFSNRDPDAIIGSPEVYSKADPNSADEAIALAYNLGTLAPNQSTTLSYVYVLREADLDRALQALAAVTILQPGGTVSGSAVPFTATTDKLADTTKIDFFVKGAKVGTDTTATAGGVYESTFNSTTLPNGPVLLTAVATFKDGTTASKDVTVTVDNSGPAIAFAKPLAGAKFSGSNIPIEINVTNPSKPPVRVSFFRVVGATETFLGEDTSAPFSRSFGVTGLADGTPVTIKAVGTDSLGRTTTITVAGAVGAAAAAAPAIASLTDSPASVVAGAPVALTAVNVTDADGDVSKVTFYRESNGVAGLQTGATGDAQVGQDASATGGYTASASTAGLAAGTYTYYARAQDATNRTSNVVSTTNVVTAPVIDRPPVADAGGPYTIDEGGSLSLDASGSTAPGGAAYSWDVDGDGTYGDATGVSPVLSWTALKALGIVDGNASSVYQAKVRITAAGNAVISPAAPVTVRNVAPVAKAGPDRSTPVGTAVTLSGAFTDPGDADTHAFQWTVRNAANAVVATSTAKTFAFTPSAAGTFTATLRVSDDDGGSTTDAAIITATSPTTAGPRIVNFSLINADTNAFIMNLHDGMTLDLSKLPRRLNVRANADPGRVGSVVIGLDDYSRVERAYPYALFSNWGNNDYFSRALAQGRHNLFATAYSGPIATGVAGAKTQIAINVINRPPVAPVAVTSFVLFNTATNKDIRVLGETDTIDLAKLPSTLGIRVTTTGSPASVVYNLTGRVTSDLSGAFKVGRHVITALPFTGPAGTGVQGAALEMRLFVIDSN